MSDIDALNKQLDKLRQDNQEFQRRLREVERLAESAMRVSNSIYYALKQTSIVVRL